MNLNELGVLLLVFVPFVLVGIGAFYGAKTGFFQTGVIKQLDRRKQFYFDRFFGKLSSIILKALLIIILTISYFLSLPIQDSFILVTLWLSFVCFRWTTTNFKELQEFTWKEYGNHRSKYDENTGTYNRSPNKFRIRYPTPELPESALRVIPSVRDSEMIFSYKLFHGKNFKDDITSWEAFIGKIKSKKLWKRKRALLIRTSSKLANNETCIFWQEKWNVRDLSPESIFKDLKSAKNFDDFAQKWHFYAILVSRKTIEDYNKWLFHPIMHLAFVLLFGLAYYFLINKSDNLIMQLDANPIVSSLLFGLSILFSVIYSVMALMLFIYGKVITIDDFNLPLARLGEPFFVETRRAALTLSISTAITVGLGIPLTLTLNFSSEISIIGAILAGIMTAFIFFLSVWGTHFSMENTKDKFLAKLFNELINEKDTIRVEVLKLKFTEIKNVPVWPLNFIVYLNIFAAFVFPILLELLFKRII